MKFNNRLFKITYFILLLYNKFDVLELFAFVDAYCSFLKPKATGT
jgi:hypothetical protein